VIVSLFLRLDLAVAALQHASPNREEPGITLPGPSGAVRMLFLFVQFAINRSRTRCRTASFKRTFGDIDNIICARFNRIHARLNGKENRNERYQVSFHPGDPFGVIAAGLLGDAAIVVTPSKKV